MWTLAVCTIATLIPWVIQTADYRYRKIFILHMDTCLNYYADRIFHLRYVGGDCLIMAECFALIYNENGRRREAL